MRPPIATIPAPPFPSGMEWVNSSPLRLDRMRGRALLVEFWDFCRVNSLRTLPYLKAWHERYAAAGPGLCVVGVHASGFAPSADPAAVREAVGRLSIEYPVAIDAAYELWQDYGNEGWPARYLFNPGLALEDFHIGEGGYRETELAVQRVLGAPRTPLQPLRPEDADDAQLAPQTPDQPGPWSGEYAAGGVWAVLDGEGVARANGRPIEVHHPGAYPLIEHDRHTAGRLELQLSDGVTCHAICFTPGVVSPARA